MNIVKYAILRIVALLMQIIGAITVIIVATTIIPLDPTVYFTVGDVSEQNGDLNQSTRSPEEIAQFRREIGLDKTFFQRYFDFLRDLFTRGDLGHSWYDNRKPVTELYFNAFKTTLNVFGLGILIFTILAIILGILSARRLDGTLDRNVRLSTSLFYSFPPYVLGTLLIFALNNYFLTNLGSSLQENLESKFPINLSSRPYETYFTAFNDGLSHAAVYQLLPIIIVVLIYTGFQFRLVRIYMANVLNQNYIRTAHAKGLSERTILIKHGLRNALPELITSVATTFPVAFSGVVVLEKVFEINGSGLLLIDAGLHFNWPVLIGGAVIFTALNAVILAVTDLIINYVDPKLRLS